MLALLEIVFGFIFVYHIMTTIKIMIISLVIATGYKHTNNSHLSVTQLLAGQVPAKIGAQIYTQLCCCRLHKCCLVTFVNFVLRFVIISSCAAVIIRLCFSTTRLNNLLLHILKRHKNLNFCNRNVIAILLR